MPKQRLDNSDTTSYMRIPCGKMPERAYGLKQRALVTAYKQPCATGQIHSEMHWDARVGMLALVSGCLVSVAGILQAWYDMWFIPAGSRSHNKNGTCVYRATLLTFAESHNKHTHPGASNESKML